MPDGEFLAIMAAFIATWGSIAGLYYRLGRLEGKLCNGPNYWSNKIEKTKELEP